MAKREKYAEAYREEALELLAELENSLIELEERPDDRELVSKIFRAMHTIKGSGAMYGFDNIAKFTHDIETVFDLVRNGEMKVTNTLITLTLAARDRIKLMLDNIGENPVPAEAGTAEILSGFRALVPPPADATDKTSVASAPAPETVETATYRIYFRPPLDMFIRGVNPAYMMNDLRGLGNCVITARTTDIPGLADINPELCYLSWDIILTTNKGINAIKDIFIFVIDESELRIDVIDRPSDLTDTNGSDYKKLGEILVEKGDLSGDELQRILSGRKRIGEMLVESGTVEAGAIEAALKEQQHVKEVRKERQSVESLSTIRVPSEKLDRLVDLVGELVTVQARLSRYAAIKSESALNSISEEVDRLISELRDDTMSIRMMPIGSTFTKFRRLVRDLSSELGKEIELTTEGAETELDKTVIEKLNDPLVHLIRNSIDHGIEMPEAREAAGKLRKGIIHLSAVHSGANVCILIMDNGAGLNRDAIRAKAIEKGVITQNAELSDKEIYSMIFAPGFSTAKQVSNVSGRGVGMDVVKRNIESLRGSIEIESVKGSGTTITLSLPLTLAIIDGFLVRVCQEYFIIPLSAVVECMELTKKHIVSANGRDIVNVRDSIVPYIRLRNHFRMNGMMRPDIEHLVIVEFEGQRVGILSDEIIGQHQTVIKNLGTYYREVEGVSGATILGDGRVALILDIQKLIQGVELEDLAAN